MGERGDSATRTERAVLTIRNRLGLHARAAALLVQTASRFRSEVTVSKDGRTVNGKSIMGLMTLAAAQGSELEVTACGEDAAEALAAIRELIDDRFHESE